MKFFVTGAAGQLGCDVIRELKRRGYEVTGSGMAERKDVCNIRMDITDGQMVTKILEEIRPDIVIHCAAWTAVDAAEDPENYEKVWAVNVMGTEHIACACRKTGAKMIYISTDYVFDGRGKSPWKPECENFVPQNIYGKTKLAGEEAVKEVMDRYFIVRIAWVFGKNGKNFVNTMLELGKKRKELCVVSDQVGTPTYTVDLAKFLADLSETDRYGCYHVTNEGDYISWYTFAKEIFRQAVCLGCSEYADVKVIPVTTEEYGISKAVRPLNSRLDRSRIRLEGFRTLPDWRDALGRYLQDITQTDERQEQNINGTDKS